MPPEYGCISTEDPSHILGLYLYLYLICDSWVGLEDAVESIDRTTYPHAHRQLSFIFVFLFAFVFVFVSVFVFVFVSHGLDLKMLLKVLIAPLALGLLPLVQQKPASSLSLPPKLSSTLSSS